MRVVAKNFRSYEYFDLTFEEGTNNLVLGDSGGSTDFATTNASGKSSIMFAVLWALFGKWPDMVAANSPINVVAGKDCEVYYEFKNTMGQPCAVKRSRKPNGLEFWGNGQHVTGDIAIVQEQIEKAIGCNYDFYLKVFLYSGDKDTKFARLRDAGQKDVLDTILPMDFEAARDLASGTKADLDAKTAEWKSSIFTWSNEVDRLTKLADLAKQDAANFAEKAKLDRTPLEYEVQKYTMDKECLGKSLEEQQQVVTNTSSDEQNARFTAARINEQVESENRRRDYISDEIVALDKRLKATEVKLGTLQGGPRAQCPMCEQLLDDQASLATVLKALQDQVKNLNGQLSEKYLERDTPRVAPEAAPDVAPLTKLYQEAIQRERQLKEQLTLADANLRKATSYLAEIPKPGTENHYHTRATVYRQEIVNLETDICSSQQQVCTLELDSHLWGHVVLALSTRGIKHYAFETLCPEMSAIAQALMHHLSADQLQLRFRSHKAVGKKVKEGFHVETTRKIGGVIKEGYGDLSGGEKSRVDLIVFLTLYLMAQKHVNNTGLLFLDEVADTLDPTGKAMIVELLDFFTREYGVTSLILTNDESIASYIPRGYRCTLNDGRGSVKLLSEG